MAKKMDAKEKWLKAVAGLYPAAKGSMREVRRNCSSPSCTTCISGTRHPAWLLTYYLDGRQHSKHIPKAMGGEMRKALENGRKLEDLMVLASLELIEAHKKK